MARLHRMDLSDPVVRDKAQQVSWVTIHRVCGEISVSRSIGDPDYKSFVPGEKVDAFFIWPDGHDQVQHSTVQCRRPHKRTHTRSLYCVQQSVGNRQISTGAVFSGMF